MATFTTRLGLLKADYTDPVDVVADINAAYDTLDTSVGAQPVISFPGSPFSGKVVQRTDLSDKPYFRQATAGRFANISFDTFIARKTVDQTLNNTATPTNDNELVINGLLASAVYTVRAYIVYTSVTAVPNISFDFTLPAGASITWTPGGLVRTAITDDGNIRLPNTPVNTPRSAATVAGIDMVAPLQGAITMGGTPGSLVLQWAQTGATAENTTVRANSWLYVQRVVS